ncbi:hypothetical protein HY090_02715 [Candidatus Kaiserbacteria bacterium]|nr:hypothetical protein [Candidatus Kaiserbacteria bacterium]
MRRFEYAIGNFGGGKPIKRASLDSLESAWMGSVFARIHADKLKEEIKGPGVDAQQKQMAGESY